MHERQYSSRRARLAQLLNVNGALLVILAVTMLPSALLAAWDRSPDLAGQVAALSLSALVGLACWASTRKTVRDLPVGHREGFLIAGVGWLVASLVGALPYFLYAHLAPGDICSPRRRAPGHWA
jgi:trk system potassium uptake protein TrkH